MAKITWLDKILGGASPLNQWRVADANETKASVNALYDHIDDMNVGAFAYLTAAGVTNLTDLDENFIDGVFTNLPAYGFEAVEVAGEPYLKYTGTKTLFFEIDLHASFSSDQNNSEIILKISKNDINIDASNCFAFLKNATQAYNASLTAVVSLETDDLIQLRVSRDSSACTLTFQTVTTTIRPFLIPTT